MASGHMLQTLQELSRQRSPGPSPAFTHIHVGQAILIIGDEAQIGRIELSRRLGIGEGATRTVIKHLTQANVIAITKDGCVLTKRGKLFYDSMKSRIAGLAYVDARQLALDKENAAVLIRGSGRLVKRGIEQRDAAIRAGATGACTLIFRGREFLMPLSEDQEWTLGPDQPLYQDLISLVPRNNDVVVISSARNKVLAEQGAMAAALTLVP